MPFGVVLTAGAFVPSVLGVTSVVGTAAAVGAGSTVGVAAGAGRGVIESSDTGCDSTASGTMAILLPVQTAALAAPGAITAETGVSLVIDPSVCPLPPATL